MIEFLWSRPETAAAGTVLLAHGSAGPMDSPFMERMAAALVAEGLAVARFEFAYMAKRRVDGKKPLPPSAEKLIAEYRNAIRLLLEIDDLVHPIVIGGKSLGGRVAAMAGGTELPEAMRGVVCLGYPFHPTGEPERLRLDPLNGCKLPLLIVQGDRDDFGNRTEVEALSLPEALSLVWLEDGSHDFGPRGQSGATLKGNIAVAATAVATMVRTLPASAHDGSDVSGTP